MKLLMETQIMEEKVCFFPRSKWIPEIMKAYKISEEQVECIYDNGDVENEVLLVNDKSIPIYHYGESVDFGTGKALIICSHHWPIIKQLAERKDFNKISIYISLNEWLLTLNEAQKEKIAQDRIDHIDGILYGLVKDRCKRKDEYVKEKILDIGKDKTIVSAAVLILTTYCTLNCKECLAGKPYRGGYTAICR